MTDGDSDYTYTWADGNTKSRIRSRNQGWNPSTLKVRDRTGGRDVATVFDPVRGSFRFRLSPGHDYDLSGGE